MDDQLRPERGYGRVAIIGNVIEPGVAPGTAPAFLEADFSDLAAPPKKARYDCSTCHY